MFRKLKEYFGIHFSQKINSEEDFWNWFIRYESTFFNSIQSEGEVVKRVIDPINSKLEDLGEGYYLLVGAPDKDKCETIFTADGDLKNFFRMYRLVDKSPNLSNWIFTALKPERGIDGATIEMGEYTFGNKSLMFHPDTSEE